MAQRQCLNCEKEFMGRTDKKFCNAYCKSSYHYKKELDSTPTFYYVVDKQLKRNRRLLKNYNKSGKSTIRATKLLKEGFDPNYFTHYWKNGKGQVYLFVYEFGFLKTMERNIEKYVLVTWQDYMSKH